MRSERTQGVLNSMKHLNHVSLRAGFNPICLNLFLKCKDGVYIKGVTTRDTRCWYTAHCWEALIDIKTFLSTVTILFVFCCVQGIFLPGAQLAAWVFRLQKSPLDALDIVLGDWNDYNLDSRLLCFCQYDKQDKEQDKAW